MKAIGLRQFIVPEDGRTIQFNFAIEGGDDVSITLDAQVAGAVAVDFVSAVSVASERSNLSKQGVIRAATPQRYRAALAEDGTAILLSFQMPNQIQYDFALPPIDARQLATQILAATGGGNVSVPLTRQ